VNAAGQVAGEVLQASERGASMHSLFRDLAASLRNPEFWALSSWLDIVVRNRQSRLGIFWLMSPAIVYVWGMGGFFASMMHHPLSSFAAYVGIGYLVFRVASSAVTESTGAFAAAGAFILDGHVRLTDFVLRVIATALFHFLLSLPVVALALAIYPDPRWSGLLFSLFSLPVVILNALWIGVVFALVGARFPDLKHLVGNIFTFVFLLTPIIWHADTMPAGSLRGSLMRFNPFYHMVELVRAPILGEAIDPSTPLYLAVMTLGGWILAILAYRRYARYVPLWI
jgi:ABC-type polysaccharide/polyol phosphate export permease